MSHNNGLDQAEGLRRMLGAGKNRTVSFLSALPAQQKNTVLLNLAAALVQKGSDVHLLDASHSAQGISATSAAPLKVSLLDVAKHNADPSKAIHQHGQGIQISKLSGIPINSLSQQDASLNSLAQTLQTLASDNGICLIDIELDNDNPFVLSKLAEGDVVIMTTTSADSIKNAYLQIKALHAQLGKRPYYVLVVSSSMQQASLIQKNMSQAANFYLAVPLISLGCIPKDDYISKAEKLGRPVIDAFPTASAAKAFRAIASQLTEPQNSVASAAEQ